jgi:hypothetical protein
MPLAEVSEYELRDAGQAARLAVLEPTFASLDAQFSVAVTDHNRKVDKVEAAQARSSPRPPCAN